MMLYGNMTIYKGSMIKEEVTRKHAEIIESLYNDLKKIKGE